MHAQTVALSIYVILKPYYDGRDVKLQITIVAMFSVSVVLSICYNSDFGLSEDGSSCDKGEEVHAYQGQRVIAPEEVATPSSAITSEHIARSSSSSKVSCTRQKNQLPEGDNRHESQTLCSTCQVHLCIDDGRRCFEKNHKHMDYCQ